VPDYPTTDSQFKVTVVTLDADGTRQREVLSINDALLAVLRFARKHPHASCTIDLREEQTLPAAAHIEVAPLAATEREPRQARTGNTIMRAFAPGH
jgi:hypothetical protein